MEGSVASAVLPDCGLRHPPKAIHYSKSEKINKATKGIACDHYSKKIFEFRHQKLEWH